MRRPLLLAVLLGLGACAEDKPRTRLVDTFATIPIPPESEALGREDGENAVQLRFKSRAAADSVADYYRRILSKAPWRLVNESKMADSSVSFYAEQNGPPLWVTVRPGEGSGSLVDLIGANVN